MAQFAVLILTAAPAGQAHEIAGPLIKIDGRETLLRTCELFLNRDNICQIQVVVAPNAAEELKRKLGVNLGFLGIKLVIAGTNWTEQLAAGAAKIDASATHVILHDGARPLVPFSDIDALMAGAENHPAVALTAPVRNSLLELDEGNAPVAIRRANEFVAMLHPQAFAKARMLTLPTKPLHASELKLIPGSSLNVRIGGAGDERLAKAMLALMPKPKMRTPNNPFEEAQW